MRRDLVPVAAVIAALALGCLRSSIVRCADGELCPVGTICAAVTNPGAEVCVAPDRLAECRDRPTYTRCSVGRCYDGVCLATACGNGRVDRADPGVAGDVGEVCDDGNQTSGDGCSSDCRSDETCGNGVSDVVTGETCDDGNLVSHDGCDSRCQRELPRWSPLATSPPPRTNPAMAFDAARGVVVMFGGFDPVHGVFLDDTWEWNGEAWSLAAPADRPSPRQTALAYDAASRRVVLFGGVGHAGATDDTWEWDGLAWRPRLAVGGPPRRYGHVMSYDSRRRRVVLFGGQLTAALPAKTDTWEWDGDRWTQAAPPTSPEGQLLQVMAYDPGRGVTVLYQTQAQLVWEYDGATWTPRSSITAPPPARSGSAMTSVVLDPAAPPRSMAPVLTGGTSTTDGAVLDDMWTWDGQSWIAIPPEVPLATTGHAMAIGRASQPVVFGGTPSSGVANAIWQWDGVLDAWLDVSPSQPPTFLEAGFGVLDTRRGVVVMYGDDQIWEFDGLAWQPSWDVRSGARAHTAAAYDVAHGVTVVFGGLGVSPAPKVPLADTWVWSGVDWTELVPASSPPARFDHAMAFDVVRGHSLMFGGQLCTDAEATCLANDTWELDGRVWTQAAPDHAPAPRANVALAYDPIRETTVMFGGRGPDPGAPLGDTWVWNGADWIEQHPPTSPLARSGASMAWDAPRRRLVLFGGDTATGSTNDSWEWDGVTWTQVQVGNAPTHVPGPSAGVLAFTPHPSGGTLLVNIAQIGPVTARTLTNLLRWEGTGVSESCRASVDADGDRLAGCADPDCWWTCSPECPPGASCASTAIGCGDGVCSDLESCELCPVDCPCVSVSPADVCGDFLCGPSETPLSCPGDCP